MSDTTDRILEAADGPAQASGQSGSMTQHNLQTLSKALKDVDAQQAADIPQHRGLRFNKIVPSGSI